MRIWNGVNKNPLFIPAYFGVQQMVRKWQKLHFTLFSCRYHSLYNICNNNHLEYQHTTPVEHC